MQMERIPEFVGNHPVLFMALGGVLTLIVITELGRLTRKFPDVTPREAVRLMNDSQALVLDVREDKETRGGALQGAKNIPIGVLGKRLDELNKHKDRSIVVYCQSGNRSVMAGNLLVKHGFTQVNNLKGGIIAWQNDSLPVVRK